MTSKLSSSAIFTSPVVTQKETEIQTPRTSSCCLSRRQSTFITFMVTAVAGGVILALGATQVFPQMGSAGYIATLASGGTVMLLSLTGIIYIVVDYKKGQRPYNPRKSQVIHTSTLETKKLGCIVHPFPLLGDQAITNAKKALADTSSTSIIPLAGLGKDSEMAKLYTMYSNDSIKLMGLIQNDISNDPWSQKNIIEAADQLLQLAYTISILTVQDLASKVQPEAQEKNERTKSCAAVLDSHDSYYHLTYYLCHTVYEWMRNGVIYRLDKKQIAAPDQVSAEYSRKFYEGEGIQRKWNQLYNEYCERITKCLSKSDLVNSTLKMRTKPDVQS